MDVRVKYRQMSDAVERAEAPEKANWWLPTEVPDIASFSWCRMGGHANYFIVGMLRFTASPCSGQRVVMTLVRV